MTLRTIPTVVLSDVTLERIQNAIISGELKPGQALREPTLSEQLGVSRTPVREALHRLESTGLVSPRGRGWEVSQFTERDVRELFQLRRLFEPEALRELAGSPDPQATADLAHFFDDYSQPIPAEQYGEYFARDNAFHSRIVACSGNERLRHMYGVLEKQIDRGRHFLTTSAEGRADATLAEHTSIADAIAAGDFTGAERALITHLQTGEDLMIDQLRRTNP
ncbi:GntR family transcriptional regulator [Mycobacterium sp. 21AC1]|uniref:GntR family transcriptional regulator n=1 Tax=[Mycobacterium] appelbergii TaxID=2939269 RepID=UPI002938DB0A|nr:GntR family transcriptional regulator [Mycobacterium sp. 21AC1]MDV3125440.1 GntR family transcriptional regulator [Mycobacterium sp. 21AC1]